MELYDVALPALMRRANEFYHPERSGPALFLAATCAAVEGSWLAGTYSQIDVSPVNLLRGDILSPMFGPPRQLDSESGLYNTAIKILMRRAHSVYEMRQALERRADDKSLVKSVLDRLKREGLLDDARYARQFAHHCVESRRQGKFRIARELRARGIPDRHIEAALAELCQETDEAALIRKRIEGKLKLLRGPNTGEKLDDRKLASLYRSLLRAGFPSDLIRRELHSLTRSQNLPENDAGPE